MFAYYSGTGSHTTAVDPDLMRDLVEMNFIDKYHWTPDYIASLSYKWIQKHNFMIKVKNEAADNRAQIQKFKNSSDSKGLQPGQKTVIEI